MSTPNHHHVERRVLPNGVRLVHVHTALPVTLISMWFPFGSRQDPAGLEGLAHLMEHLVMKTTPKLPTVAATREFFAKKGIRYNATTYCEAMNFRFLTLSEDAISVVPIFLEQLQTSTFAADRLEVEKGIVVGERAGKANRILDLLMESTRAALFPGSGLNHPILGTTESIAAVTWEDAYTFAKENIHDAPKTFVICSPHGADDFAAALSSLPPVHVQTRDTSKMRAASAPVPLMTVPKSVPSVNVAYSFSTCGFENLADYRVLQLFASAYLAGAGSSRLAVRMREDRGLCYGVGGLTQVYTDGGSFTARFTVPKEKVQEAIACCEQEFERLRNGDIDAELFAAAKREFRFSLLSRCMDPEEVAFWYGLREVYGQGSETFDECCAAVDKITLVDAVRVARRYFVPERRSIVLMGDVE